MSSNDATFEGHHGSINVQLSFSNCSKKNQNAPRPSLFPTVVSCTSSDMPHVKDVTALLHQQTVAEISKISHVTEGAAAPNAQAQ